MSVKLYANGRDITLSMWKFPAGERGVAIVDKITPTPRSAAIQLNYESDQDFVDMLMLVNAIRYEYPAIQLRADIPYFPYARQDRVMNHGEAFSLQVAVSLVSMCDFYEISVLDPHSDVLMGMFKPGILNIKSQWELWNSCCHIGKGVTVGNTTTPNHPTVLLSPDAGALKKIYKLGAALGLPVICATKVRDTKTGAIVSTKIDCEDINIYDKIYIVDDICDGGATYIGLANVIRNELGFNGVLTLCTTHGIYSKGKQVILDSGFDELKCINNMEKQK